MAKKFIDKDNIETVLTKVKAYTDDKLQEKQDSLTFDTTPTLNSTNPVTSSGIKIYVDTVTPAVLTNQEIDNIMDSILI